MKVYILQAEHWFVPGIKMQAFSNTMALNAAAAVQVNALRRDLGLKTTARHDNWQSQLLSARQKQARECNLSLDELSGDSQNGDVWVTELELQS